jgi:hypothetical protein
MQNMLHAVHNQAVFVGLAQAGSHTQDYNCEKIKKLKVGIDVKTSVMETVTQVMDDPEL